MMSEKKRLFGSLFGNKKDGCCNMEITENAPKKKDSCCKMEIIEENESKNEGCNSKKTKEN